MSKNTETQANEESSGVDILSFDVVTPCEKARPLQMKDAKGNKLPIKFLVIGAYADVVVKYNDEKAVQYLDDRAIAEKMDTVHDLNVQLVKARKFNEVNGAAIKVTGWEGVTQKFNPQVLKMALEKNPHWVIQINEFSEKVGDFT
jgi:hypothetical protein